MSAPELTVRPAARRLWRGGRLVTFQDREGWGLVADGAMVTAGETLLWVGALADLPEDLMADLRHGQVEEHDLGGALVTPGLIDAHTHLVYGGERSAEFELRLQGASYEDIARAGGGIRSTVAATRAASEADLLSAAEARARALMAEGLTTLEVKSGYGLALAEEAKCLRVARRLSDLGLTVRTTFLGAHALPPEFDGRADDYVDAVCAWMPQLQREGLVDAVDAFCERIAFSPAQTRRIFEAARALGLPVKLHAEQLSDQGGAALAAEFQALSCDHLEYLSESGIQAMARAGTVAMLLPGAFYFLRETRLPPIEGLRAAGVPIALASDHNPGSAPGLSLLLMLNMACTFFRMTPEEALRGLTVNAAQALGLRDRGQLVAGQRADFCVWDAAHPRELAYYFGRNPRRTTVIGGRERG
ncbi:imidazolonepropionase [Roseateles sp. YR242]|uniref:imidazolonepropionase n=1 Tax=Roseateles sp. YR242 TaxID=1855305 RepID=UPI0008BADBC7|nr:imidazolonepropionase [Roseateles sp. YR242]SEK50686.1 imidazolonepropionase [Roseateles sp. YR242]